MDEPQEAADSLQWYAEVGAREEYEAWLQSLDEQWMKLLQQENYREQIESY